MVPELAGNTDRRSTMRLRRSTGLILADAGEEQAKKSSPIFKKLMQGSGHAMSHGGDDSMREDIYKGHRITVMTTYQIRIDGKLFKGQLGVSNAGDVHYHGIPNVGFTSAMDLVRSVIDTFPDDFPVRKGTAKPPLHTAKSVAAKPTKKKSAAANDVKGGK
jgi:hypothetical protein